MSVRRAAEIVVLVRMAAAVVVVAVDAVVVRAVVDVLAVAVVAAMVAAVVADEAKPLFVAIHSHARCVAVFFAAGQDGDWCEGLSGCIIPHESWKVSNWGATTSGGSMRKFLLGLLLLVLFTSAAYAQDADAPHVVKMAATKFMNLPMLPKCMQISAQEGDPMKGAAVILIKMTSGCTIPWHWHTAREQLFIASGRGKAEMKDHGGEAVGSGDFVYLTAKKIHQFTCTASCVFFDVTDGAFDVHYVNADGTEIPAEEALKSKSASPHAKAKPKTE